MVIDMIMRDRYLVGAVCDKADAVPVTDAAVVDAVDLRLLAEKRRSGGGCIAKTQHENFPSIMALPFD